jgi:hypothetical protein
MTVEITDALRQQGFARVPAAQLAELAALASDDLRALEPTWERLPRDSYLKDGGRYRARRHSCFVQSLDTHTLVAVPHRAHWQSTTYNALHGGLLRWFEPIEPEVIAAHAWRKLLVSLGETFASVLPVPAWYIEAHQFRIDTAGGVGRPTPEGAHRDGVDFVAILLVARRGISGGETRVFEADGPNGVRFTLAEPWSALLLDDSRVVHETTPIQPLDASVGGQRDTLVLTFRAGGFQAPP